MTTHLDFYDDKSRVNKSLLVKMAMLIHLFSDKNIQGQSIQYQFKILDYHNVGQYDHVFFSDR